MPKKAANNEGSLTYRKARKRWEARITVDHHPDGRPIRRTVIGKTRAEALERLDALKRAVAAGPGLPAEVTVGRYLEHWLTAVLPLTDTAPTTRVHYERMVRLYIVPTLGRTRLDRLTPAHVRTMLTRLREQGLSPSTQRLARACLRRALRTAEADGLIGRNAAALVDGVRTERTEGRTLTPEQARTLLASIDGHRHEALITLLVSLGLRRGEALALGWADLDLDRTPATLTVRRAVKKTETGDLYLDEPKTAGSRRTIHLPAQLVDVLRRHRARQAAERLEFGPGWGGKWARLDLVFTSSIGTVVDPDNFAKELGRITTAAGLGRWTPHQLRHSAASLLIAQNVPLKTISELLGHSSIRITADTYGHLLEPARTEAAEAMAAMLWG